MKIGDKSRKQKVIAVAISFALQAMLGSFLGHEYDMEVFFAAGYSVANGMTPYRYHSARSIFNNSIFPEQVPGIGYPPPWALLLGVIYSAVYAPTKNLFAYNLATKLPIIVSNIGLAFLVEKIASQEGADRILSSKMFYFLLFNPFLIYGSSLWGQFDSVVILTVMLAIESLVHNKMKESSLLFALSVSLKILPLVLLPLLALYARKNYGLRRCLTFLIIFSVSLLVLVYLPFPLFNWDLSLITQNFDFHFTRAGCFTFFNILELAQGGIDLPRALQATGYVWIIALLLVYWQFSKTSLRNRMDFFRWTSGVLFVLMLTRTWLSEQNIILLIPLIMLQSVTNSKNWVILRSIWIITFVFAFLNTSPFQMFFLVSQRPMELMKGFDQSWNTVRLFLRFLSVFPWQIAGWSHVTWAIAPHVSGRCASGKGIRRLHVKDPFRDLYGYARNQSSADL